MRTGYQVWAELSAALHELRVIEVPDYGLTNYAVVCGCEWESKQVTTEREAADMQAAGCPIEALERESARLRAARLAQQRAQVA
jgi:hypothetical protein